MATTALDRKFDRIRAREEAGLLKPVRGSRALRKLMANRLAMLGVAIFTTILLASIFAPLLTSHDPLKIDLRAMLQAPSAEHWFGTDQLGRDVYSRVIYGSRISLLVGFSVAVLLAIVEVSTRIYASSSSVWA